MFERSRKQIECMQETLLKGCNQHQVVRRKQAIDPALSSNDVHVYSAFYPYNIQSIFKKECS